MKVTNSTNLLEVVQKGSLFYLFEQPAMSVAAASFKPAMSGFLIVGAQRAESLHIPF
jgi:hypothetical protein